MTTIHRKSLDSDRLGTYIRTTNGFVRESLEILENRPKTRLLLTRRFWTAAVLIFMVVILLSSFSVYQLFIIQDRNSEELRSLNGLSAVNSELLAGTLAINSVLTEVRFSSSNLETAQINSLKQNIDGDLKRLELLAFELNDVEINKVVSSLALTIGTWENILDDLTNIEISRSLEFAEVELIGAVARTTELLESQLNLRIGNLENLTANKSRTAVIVGVLALLFATFGTVLLVPMAIAGSIERLVILQKSNRERESRLGLATSSFLDNVNLELRTPLTSISGFSEILSNNDDLINQSQQQRMIQTIYRNSQKLNELVDNVLTMCKIQTREIRFKFSEFDARDVLQAEVGRRQELSRISDVKIDFILPNDPIPIVGDFEEISRAIRALLDNAITYSKKEGVVEVSVRRSDDPVDGPMAIFVVKDRGIGIPGDELVTALDAFERASNVVELSIGGAGLGLSIVDFIVFEHGGEWRITSVEGEGTEVELHFPCLRMATPESVSLS